MKQLVVFSALLACAILAMLAFELQPGHLGNTVPTLVKLTGLSTGAIFAWRSVATFERGSAVRFGWIGVAAWLTTWALGQSVFTFYLLARHQYAPTPSLADPLFVLGYACAVLGLFAFVIAWRRSGMVETRKTLITVVIIVLALVVTVAFIFPVIARTDAPFLQKAIVLLYPGLDLVLLVPAALLLQMSSVFGGAVRKVWLWILSGILAFCAGDIAYAYFSALAMDGLLVAIDLGYCAGYTAVGIGAWLQAGLADK